MDKIEAAMHELGAEFAAGLDQDGSMQAALSGYGRRSQTYDAAGNGALIGRWDDDLSPGLRDLMGLVTAGAGGTGEFVVELSGTRAGDYVVSCSADLLSLPPRVVLDADYRYPNHPAPGMAKPAAAANDGRPTDPAVLAEVRALVAEFLAQRDRLYGESPRFAPGHSEAEILAVEEQLGVRLPEDLRALYRTIHDDGQESGLLGRFSPASLEQVVRWYHEGDPGSYGWDDGLFEDDPVVFETHPFGHVRRLSRDDWWVTFASDHAGNFAAVDLDPAGLGSYGQVLTFGRDVWGPIQYVAPSVRHLMRSVVASLRDHARWDDGSWTTPNHEWSVDVGRRTLAEAVAAAPDPSVVQAAHLRAVTRVRLADLAAFPHLRAVRILDVRQKAEHVDLAIPTGLPVEQVHVVAARFEPERLAATPTLGYLTLAGNTEPVSVAALAALPNLVRLDLADAAVTDVVAVAGFPALRVLGLNARQWEALLDTGWTPGRLAAIELGGRASVPEAAAWLTRIRALVADRTDGTGQPVVRYRTVRGRR
ncbi:SMI1/KNR4 family protein [Micromonospora psammae]|uniref:SMI1/KNR4 family protein n=1 Tax=Micromonospora sp. CPCC 205556 TaxID=3122398 RepID=UPI002FEE9CFF